MVDLAGSEVAAYGEPNEPTRTVTTGFAVTELLLYRRPEGGCYYPWLEDYLTWLEGKEAHREYHAWLKQTPPWWERSILVTSGACEKSLIHEPVGRDGSGRHYGNEDLSSSITELVSPLRTQASRALTS